MVVYAEADLDIVSVNLVPFHDHSYLTTLELPSVRLAGLLKRHRFTTDVSLSRVWCALYELFNTTGTSERSSQLPVLDSHIPISHTLKTSRISNLPLSTQAVYISCFYSVEDGNADVEGVVDVYILYGVPMIENCHISLFQSRVHLEKGILGEGKEVLGYHLLGLLILEGHPHVFGYCISSTHFLATKYSR
ncbi:uncharacterized protein BDR25DRAFT_351802 [Lindgomyces ingoldianus]|uniref:Uncharacterized protein n=1 Tax=Lindgomyces ingoldianus TaxID=673940 RepID=A0ACB6R7E8_9PLEO|nr:uncharacterized protein BDR25DRAFT_351802 [Lindgomyces ingoldianus]KAF2474247.1 hypothetical protein BDR25DRAFT_351802 [Lindgomyces ingoldianus]